VNDSDIKALNKLCSVIIGVNTLTNDHGVDQEQRLLYYLSSDDVFWLQFQSTIFCSCSACLWI